MKKMDSEANGANLVPPHHAIDFAFPSRTNSFHESVRDQKNKASSTARTPSLVGGVSSGAMSTLPLEPSYRASTSKPRPRLLTRKNLTERPVPAPRQSRYILRRGQTGHVPTALNTATWQSDSSSDSDFESSSSSSDPDKASTANVAQTAEGKLRNSVMQTGGKDKSNAHRRMSSGPQFSRFSVGNGNFKTRGKVSKTSGRLNISVNETSNHGYLVKALGATLQRHLKPLPKDEDAGTTPRTLSPFHKEDIPKRPELLTRLSTLTTVPNLGKSIPTLNLVIMVIGSRGDIQPFLKLGKLLKEEHGHRVRIATHPAFKEFVEQDSGLEFFSVGGDPAELMAFMVKNPGLIPSVSTVKAGEIGRKRDSMFEMFQGFWRACINATDDEANASNRKMMHDKHPFVADAIIANPPSFAHIHCAERLGIPLHLMFTFPYSPTEQFPHPLANIKKSNVDTNYTNFISYPLVEMMTWQGLGDLVNRFRVETLGLEPVSTLWAPGQLFRLKVPYTYLWSPGLIPKPADWGPEIDIAGFVFLDLASSFQPPKALAEFLEAGEPPVYIGFGSIVVDDPDRFTALIFEAVKKAGVRALVSKGWGGLGDEGNTPENIYMLENTPHDWLFPRVSAVIHHGGAGTTAIGLKCGKPTMIVPFFGDQPFWGAMVSRAGAGAHEPIPYKHLSVEAFAEGIQQCLSPEAKAAAEKIAQDIALEGDGASNAVESFHNHLQLQGEHTMRCSVFQDRIAVWEVKKSIVRLSALAAELLVLKKKLKWHEMRLIRHQDWNDFEGPGEPFTGGGGALLNSAGGIVKGVGGVPLRWAKSLKKRDEAKERERKRSEAPVKNVEADQSVGESRQYENRPGPSERKFSLDGKHGIETHLQEDFRSLATDRGLGRIPHRGVDNYDADATLFNTREGSRNNIAQDIAAETGLGLAKSGEALAKVPMDLALAIAQGFHNAPRLYGDSTVRTPTRISGIKSGLRAAGKEFTFGIYDGVSGLVLQPYNGAKQEGPLGFVQGLGKGFGGFVLKDIAAVIGPIGFTLKGVHKELVKGKKLTGFIRRARMIQGEDDLKELNERDTKAMGEKIEAAWNIVEEIRREVTLTREEGLGGRVAVMMGKQRLSKQGAFESVESSRKAFLAWKTER
ncbi:hypothetical protein MMC29_005686, partial [Sticta canariensis]|nr:hypothetical protein [Sticta canariensis]